MTFTIIGWFFGWLLIGAWKYRRFKISFPDRREVVNHFFAGTLMGTGAAAALGGNDFQLLLAIPAFSLAGLLAILGILLGIRVGIAYLGNRSSPLKEHEKQMAQTA